MRQSIIHAKTCIQMFIAGLFIIAQSEKSPKCSSADTWINITWYIPTREHYLPIKSKDVLMHDMEQPWKHWNLETIMLNYRRLHIIWSYWYEMSRVTQSRLVIHRDKGGNGKPLQCSCLENLMDQGSCWTIDHGVAKSQTRLSD